MTNEELLLTTDPTRAAKITRPSDKGASQWCSRAASTGYLLPSHTEGCAVTSITHNMPKAELIVDELVPTRKGTRTACSRNFSPKGSSCLKTASESGVPKPQPGDPSPGKPPWWPPWTSFGAWKCATVREA
jgi:hypothetical protein